MQQTQTHLHCPKDAIPLIPLQSPELQPVPEEPVIIRIAKTAILLLMTIIRLHLVQQVRVVPPVDDLIGRDVATNLPRLQNPQVHAIHAHPANVDEEEGGEDNVEDGVVLLLKVERMG